MYPYACVLAQWPSNQALHLLSKCFATELHTFHPCSFYKVINNLPNLQVRTTILEKNPFTFIGQRSKQTGAEMHECPFQFFPVWAIHNWWDQDGELLNGTRSSQLSAKTKPIRQSEKTFKMGLWRQDKLCNSVSTGCLCCTGLDWLQLSWVWTWDSTKRITHTLTSSYLLVGTWRPLSQRTKCLVLAIAILMSQTIGLPIPLPRPCPG